MNVAGVHGFVARRGATQVTVQRQQTQETRFRWHPRSDHLTLDGYFQKGAK